MQELTNYFAFVVIYKQEVIIVPVYGQKLILIILYHSINEAADLIVLLLQHHRHGQSSRIFGNRDKVNSSVAAEYDCVLGLRGLNLKDVPDQVKLLTYLHIDLSRVLCNPHHVNNAIILAHQHITSAKLAHRTY
jgi:hypothetical protein